jgi:hypothetical protein
MTPGGMYCAYLVPAFTTSSPAKPSSRLEQSSRIIGSRALIGPGAKAGKIKRRAIAWNGGSDVMGGATPIGAGRSSSVGRPLPMTTVRLVKFSVSLAISDTPACVAGNQPPP